jgi:hypothetical protein
VKINNLDTCCEQVEEGRTAKQKLFFSLDFDPDPELLLTPLDLPWPSG